MKAYRFAGVVLLTGVLLLGLAVALASARTPASADLLPARHSLKEDDRAYVAATESISSIVPIGPDIPISEDMGREIQGKPAIAFDGSNFIVVWVELASYNIYGARVSWDGTVLDTTPISISVDINDVSRQPSVIYDGSNFFVVWAATRGGTNELYGARIASDGTVLDPTGIQLTTGGAPLIRMPGMAFNGDDTLIVWRTTASDIRAARVLSDGTNLDAPNGFPITNLGRSYYPAVAFDGNNYLVIWHDSRNEATSGYDVYGARVTQAGTVLDPNGFVICDDPLRQEHGNVGWNGSNYIVAWQHTDGTSTVGSISATRVSTNGVVLDASSIHVMGRTFLGFPVQIACDGPECLIVASVEHGVMAKARLTDVYAYRISPDGVILDQPGVPVSTAYGNQIGAVVGYGNGRFLTAWAETTRVDYGVYGQILVKQPAAQDLGRYAGVAPSTCSVSSISGTAWITETIPRESFFGTNGMAFNSTNAYVLGRNVYHYTGTQWFEDFSTTNNIHSIWASGPNNIWIGSFCRGTIHYDGVSWDYTGCWNTPDTYGILSGIWGSSPTDIWASSCAGDVLHFDGDWWWETISTTTPYDLWDIWGAAPDNIYAVGSKGTIVRYDGVDWSNVDDIPTIQALSAIWGSSAQDIYVVGDWGTILHYDGASWNHHDSGTAEHLFDVWGLGSSNVWAVGYGGTILHYDGSSWQTETVGTNQDFLSVWGVVDREVPVFNLWVAGSGDVIWKKSLPAAAFAAAPTSGVVPLTTTFTNTSTISPTSILWDFGDGVTSTLSNPIHTYHTPGVYTVALSVNWPTWADTLTRTSYITAYAPVQAGFTAAPSSGVVPLTVTFANTSTGDYTISLWSFGDGVTSTLENPSHTYTAAGAYPVSLEVSGPGGMDALTRTNYITAYAPVEAGFAGNPTSGLVPLTVGFTNTTTGDYDSSLWDFGDGVTSTLESPTHIYSAAGAYTVTLTAGGLGGNDTEVKAEYITVQYGIYLPLVRRDD